LLGVHDFLSDRIQVQSILNSFKEIVNEFLPLSPHDRNLFGEQKMVLHFGLAFDAHW
jgi:hypothetical protein